MGMSGSGWTEGRDNKSRRKGKKTRGASRHMTYGHTVLILETRCLLLHIPTHTQTHTHLTLQGILISFGPYETDGIVHVNPSLPSKTDPASDSKHSGNQPRIEQCWIQKQAVTKSHHYHHQEADTHIFIFQVCTRCLCQRIKSQERRWAVLKLKTPTLETTGWWITA